MSIKQQLQEEYDKRAKRFKEPQPDGSTYATEPLEDVPRELIVEDMEEFNIPVFVQIGIQNYSLNLGKSTNERLVYELDT